MDDTSSEQQVQVAQATVIAARVRKHRSLSRKQTLWMIAGIVAWLVIWQVVAMAIGQEIILASPWQVIVVLAHDVVTPSFWLAAWTTAWHIAVGFVAALVIGAVLAWLASLSRVAAAFFAPPIRVMRSVPVVSFIILLLIWGGSSWLAAEVACLMVLPVAYDNISQGVAHVPVELREMAKVYRISRWRTLRSITIPSLFPYVIAACRIGVGLAWKAGISAEVIGLPGGTIGARLYNARLYLATGDLFAWTVVVVVLGIVMEKIIGLVLDRAEASLEKVGL
jgi:NitT/TauT family transport system permease protein